MNQAMHADDPAYFKVPDDSSLISQYLLLYSMSGDPGDFDAYVDNGYRRGNITALLKTDSSAYIADLMPKLQAEVAARFDKKVSVSFGGSVPQTAALSEVIIHSKITNILQVCAVVFLVSALVLRSLLAGALVLVPLILAVIANFGLMGLFGIPLNIPTSLCSAMAVGIGADYSIYMIFRLREQMRGAADESAAIAEVIRTAGKAVLFVASAVACGYGVLLFSPGFHVHQWMALLIATAMLVSAVSALLLVPALVASFRPRFIFGGQERAVMVGATPIAAMIGALILLALAPARPVWADDSLDASAIMKRNFMVSKVIDSTFDATITLITSSNEQRVRKTIGATKLEGNGVDAMRMTRFLAPDDVRGTVSLLVEHSDADDGMWIYLPALKKVRRMVSSNKKESFVGTDFSYGDVIGHRVDQWQHTRKADEVVDGQDCYVIESTPASSDVSDDSGYSKRVSWISKSSFVSVKGRFYGTNGELLKETSSSDIREVDAATNRWQPMKMEADNLQTGHKTVITFENYKVNQGVSAELFTTRSMEQMS
jgi:outer membrane lipoprotein-sorting protein